MNRKIILFTVVIFIMITGCKKEETIKEIIPVAVMSAKINGVSWTSVARATEISNGKIIITGTGTSSGEKVINLTIFSDTTGTYKLSINPVKTDFAASYNPSISTITDSSYVAYSGTVVVSKKDVSSKKISGTFSFSSRKALNPLQSIEVTEGVFTNLLYTEL